MVRRLRLLHFVADNVPHESTAVQLSKIDCLALLFQSSTCYNILELSVIEKILQVLLAGPNEVARQGLGAVAELYNSEVCLPRSIIRNFKLKRARRSDVTTPRFTTFIRRLLFGRRTSRFRCLLQQSQHCNAVYRHLRGRSFKICL